MRQKLNLITLGVSNFKRSLAFYETGLGWKKSKSSMDDLALFPLGGMVLALYPKRLLAEDAAVSPVGSGFPGVTLSYNAKSEREVEEVLNEVKALGATIVKPAQKFSGADIVVISEIPTDIYLKWRLILPGNLMTGII
jgi:predicted enzyme related to lactoylglutathione lyase